ncbi:MAG: hypothetical protein HQL64_13755 [Magnetococcales bacterium]|nr:hypothetical protein [Magnetococcales bacterium]
MKPALILFGNCHAVTLFHVFRERHEELRDTFTLGLFRRGSNDFFASDDVSPEEALSRCVLFLRQKTFWDDPFPFDEAIPASCRIVRYPMLSCELLWPSYMDPPKPLPFNIDSNRRRSHGDRLLHSLLRRNLPPRQTLADYLATDLHQWVDLDRARELYFEKLRHLDREVDIPVADFIEANFQHRQLFVDSFHPHHLLLLHMAYRALQAGGLDIDSHIDEAPIMDLSVTHPIHPQVIDHFGLTWVSPSSRYGFFSPKPYLTNLYDDGYQTKEAELGFVAFLRKHLGLPDALAYTGEGSAASHLAALEEELRECQNLTPHPGLSSALENWRAQILTALGDSHLFLGNRSQAMSRYQEALRADPGYYPLTKSLLHLLMGLDRKEQALRVITTFMDGPGFINLSIQEWVLLAETVLGLYNLLMQELLDAGDATGARACRQRFERLFPRLGLAEG